MGNPDGGPDAYTESDSERDGFLSYSAEWHSLTHGLSDGAKDWRQLSPDAMPQNRDVDLEPHYYKGGFLIGTLLQAAVVLGVLYLGIDAAGAGAL